ncbi:threonylcarbamoyl-AMP synthase [Candidatus Woesearchaeota archaeon]|nr:threonylcarbamoyl-AMP synthase [Candidatus Woesearchaeota archaeon]
MEIITKEQFFANKQKYLQLIRKGAIFVYPTDTVYGIGCDAQNEEAVATISRLKHRPATSQFSVIVPSKQWIHNNCILSKKAKEWLTKLPGPYTFILPRKRIGQARCEAQQTIGVRIPNHWIRKVIQELGLCSITTSVNRSGSQPITNVNAIPPGMKKKIAFCIDEGTLQGSPSMLVYLTDKDTWIKKR